MRDAFVGYRGPVAAAWLEGVGLHTGEPCRARWVRAPGALQVRRVDGAMSGCTVGLDAAIPTLRATRLTLSDGRTVETVEHALAAAGARGCFADLVLEVEGPEVPLLDGTARAWCAALEALGARASGPSVRVTRAEVFTVEGGSTLRLAPGPRAVEVLADFGHRGLGALTARWAGDWEGFVTTVAPARTFGFLDEADALRAAGRAHGVTPEAVVVYGPGGVADPRFAPAADATEPARHKLLDAIGDLALLGCGIDGEVVLERPGHARTLALLRAAVAAGALAGS